MWLRPIRYSGTFTAALLAALALAACDRRTAEEKGRDYAEDKLDFAQGAADTLKEKGKTLGQTAGHGVGDLVKGVGSGVKDAARPEVPTQAEPAALAAGVSVHHAQEGALDGDVRWIDTYVEFAKVFQGRLELLAFDAAGQELGRGVLTDALDLPAGSREQLSFRFSATVRFSHVTRYTLRFLAGPEVKVVEGLAGVSVSQFRQKGAAVTLYVSFASAWKGTLELRAFGADGAELGRSKKTAKLTQAADSAEFMDFTFDERARLERATRFELR
ncbi:MAG TPA: hypothetical protein VLC09_13745 [Polyangiaceae bacterium]|nr:hypothetical protein [Polyangiaceae bacterium]